MNTIPVNPLGTLGGEVVDKSSALEVSAIIHRFSPLCAQGSVQVLVVFFDSVIQLGQFPHLPTGMQNRGMITTAEAVADFRKTMIRQFFCQCHGQLTWAGNGAAATFG